MYDLLMYDLFTRVRFAVNVRFSDLRPFSPS